MQSPISQPVANQIEVKTWLSTRLRRAAKSTIFTRKNLLAKKNVKFVVTTPMLTIIMVLLFAILAVLFFAADPIETRLKRNSCAIIKMKGVKLLSKLGNDACYADTKSAYKLA